MTIELPAELTRALPGPEAERPRRAMESLVIGLYAEGVFSRGRACELLGLDPWSGDEFLRERGLPPRFEVEHLLEDLRR